METKLISLLLNTEISKKNVDKILKRENISIGQLELVDILYKYLRNSPNSINKWYVTLNIVTRKLNNYKKYLMDQFVENKNNVQLFKYYYKKRIDFINDLCVIDNKYFSKLSGLDIGCDFILFSSSGDNIVVEFPKNLPLKEYDKKLASMIHNIILVSSLKHKIITGKSLKYWRYQATQQSHAKLKKKKPVSKKPKVHNDDILDESWNARYEQYMKLCKIKSPEQRSNEWFKQRENSITASVCGSILGKDKYKNQYEFIEEKIQSTFKPNKNCYHGTKYEEIAKLIYEDINDVSVKDFGLLTHPNHEMIAASPDGICSEYKKDKKSKSNKVGRMIEIKCVTTRKIICSDKISEVVPSQYYEQIQQQLECCSLDNCDFFQCLLKEYDNYDDYINDSSSEHQYISKTTNNYKGCLIELLPFESFKYSDIEFDNEVFGKAKFIYPKMLHMSNDQYDLWLCKRLANIKFPGYVFHKVKYWRLELSHCITVPRDIQWLSNAMTHFKKIWGYVNMFRDNKNKFEKYKKYKKTLQRDLRFMRVNDIFCSPEIKQAFNNKLMKYIDKMYYEK